MVLLTLGGVLLAVGAVLFLAVAWAAVGVGGRTVMLALFALVAGWATWFVTKRGLSGAAETLAALTVALAGLVCGGAYLADWFGDASLEAVLAGSGVVVGLLAIGGGRLLERSTSKRLWSPQLTGSAALDVAAVAAFDHFPGAAATATVVTLAGIAVAFLGRMSGQTATRWNAYAAAGLSWLTLAGLGLGRTAEHLPTHAWSDVGPLVTAGGLAAILVPPTRLVATLPSGFRVAAGVVAVWLLGLAATAWALGTVASAVLVLALFALAAAAHVLLLRPARERVDARIARGVAATTALVAAGIAALWLVGFALVVVTALIDVWDGSGAGWDARYDIAELRRDLSPFVVALGAVALTAAAAAWGTLGRARRLLPVPSLATLGLGAMSPLLLGYTDRLLLVVVVLGLMTLLEVAAARTAPAHWLLALTLAMGTGLAAAYDWAPGTVAAAVAALIGAVHLRWGRPGEAFAAALATPPLLAIAASCLATWTGLDHHWGGILAVGATLVLGLSALLWAREATDDTRSRWALHGATIVAALVAVAIWAVDADAAGLLVTLVAAAASLIAVHERQPLVAPGVAVTFAAAWLGLGATVDDAPEPYSIPAGVVVLGLGAWLLRSRGLTLLSALGPGVAIGLIPSTGVALADGVSVRGFVVAVSWTIVAAAVLHLAGAVPATAAAFLGAAPPTAALAIGADLAGLDAGPIAVACVAGSALFTLAVILPRWSPALEDRTIRIIGYLAATASGATGAFVADPPAAWLAAALTGLAAAAGLAAVRERHVAGLVVVALGTAVTWLGLATSVTGVPEAYTLPLAALVTAYGVFQLRGGAPLVPSLGPGVAIGLLPSTALALADPISPRGLLVALVYTLVTAAAMRLAIGPSAVAAAALAAVAPACALRIGADLAGLDRPWVGAVSLAGVLAFTLSGVVLGWAKAILGHERWIGYGATLAIGGPLIVWGATSETWLSIDLTILAAGTAIVAIHERDRWIAALSSLFGLCALWVRLHDSDIAVPEAYTLPLAGVVLAFGGWTMWRSPALRSFPTIGPGLTLGLVPSFVLALRDPYTLRGLLVGLGCLAFVAVGASRRWQAPFVLGALFGLTMVILGVGPYLRHVPPTWLVILAGAALLGAGISWERLARAGRRSWAQVTELR